MTIRSIASLFALACAAALIAATPLTRAADTEDKDDRAEKAEKAGADVKLTVIPSGAMPKVGGYVPHRVGLSAHKPDALKKAPEMAAPLYGEVRFAGRSYVLAVDEPEGKEAKLYVDANGNGDLTDEPEPKWEKRPYPGGAPLTQYTGSFQLPLPGAKGADGPADKPTLVSFGAYRFDKNDPQRAALKDTLLYYADYAYEGEITLGGAKYRALLVDDSAAGDFGAPAEIDAKPQTNPGAPPAPAGPSGRLLIDLNGDGKFGGRGEMYNVRSPFNIKGTTWELAGLSADGSFKVVKSNREVAEVLPPPDLSAGKNIGTFKATKTDGSEVNFPADYKGKLVMLDFWATWCGPCMAEVPGLVKAYNEFHPRGIEILGISLDQPNAADKVKSVTADKGMTWPQVYDGKFWQAEVARKYGIEAIPAAVLVDGDTGEIVASGDSLRGEELAKTFETALAKKTAKGKKVD